MTTSSDGSFTIEGAENLRRAGLLQLMYRLSLECSGFRFKGPSTLSVLKRLEITTKGTKKAALRDLVDYCQKDFGYVPTATIQKVLDK